MSLFKKFTDFCAGVAAFVGGLFIIQKYMAFKPKTDAEYIQWISKNPDYSKEYVETVTEAPGKFSQFTTPALTRNIDYRPLILLVVLFIVAIAIGRIVKKYPHVCFAVSLLPAISVAYFVFQGTLQTQPGLFITLSFLFVLGNLVECILRDKEDGGHRLWIASRISITVPAFACLAFTVLPMIISTKEIKKDLIAFPELLFGVNDTVTEILVIAGIMFATVLLISTLLYNVYFVDAVLSAVPLGYLIFVLYGEKFTAFTSMLLFCAVICFTSCLLLCLFENNLSKKEQIPAIEQGDNQINEQKDGQEDKSKGKEKSKRKDVQNGKPKSSLKDKAKVKPKENSKVKQDDSSKKSNKPTSKKANPHRKKKKKKKKTR